MTAKNRSRNRALLRFILLPMIFLAVVLLGGLRVDADTRAFVFVGPPLITLILSVLLMLLCVRGRLVKFSDWVSGDLPALTNTSHVLTLLSFYFASAQALNSVLPERGLLFWLFSFFFLWTLWNNQFSNFDARRLLRSLGVLFATAFFLKHIILASLFSPGGGFIKKLSSFVVNVGTLGTLDFQLFHPATGYISFFTLALYVCGLIIMTPPSELEKTGAIWLVRAYEDLPALERAAVRRAIAGDEPRPISPGDEPASEETVEIRGELVDEK